MKLVGVAKKEDPMGDQTKFMNLIQKVRHKFTCSSELTAQVQNTRSGSSLLSRIVILYKLILNTS